MIDDKRTADFEVQNENRADVGTARGNLANCDCEVHVGLHVQL